MLFCVLFVYNLSAQQTQVDTRKLLVRQTAENLGLTTLRGYVYAYDSVYFQPNTANIPFLPTASPVGWVLTTKKGTTAQLVRTTLPQLYDAMMDTVSKAPTASTTWIRGTNNLYPATATDTVKVTGLLKLPLATATTGIVYKAGNPWLHDFYKSGTNGNNIWLGRAGNLTLTGSTSGDDGSANIGIGYNTLLSLTTGKFNTAIGYRASEFNTTGSGNTAFGYNANQVNAAGTDYVTAIGYMAARNNDSDFITAVGAEALTANTTGQYNTAVGRQALYSNVTNNDNTAVGYQAGYSLNGGYSNVAIGTYAMGASSDSAVTNVAVGTSALSKSNRACNVGVGASALKELTLGLDNVGIGTGAGLNRTHGNGNNAIGVYSQGRYNMSVLPITGYGNNSMGTYSLASLSTGGFNTVIGDSAGYSQTTASRNVFLGNKAGFNTTLGDRLIIDNQKRADAGADTTDALIYGNFSAKNVTVNGHFGAQNTTTNMYFGTNFSKYNEADFRYNIMAVDDNDSSRAFIQTYQNAGDEYGFTIFSRNDDYYQQISTQSPDGDGGYLTLKYGKDGDDEGVIYIYKDSVKIDSDVKVTGGLTMGDPTDWVDAFRKRPFYMTDMLGSNYFPFYNSAISSGTLGLITADANHPGVVSFVSSTSANSGYSMQTFANQVFVLGGGEFYEVIFKPILLAGTTICMGYQNSITNAEPTDGVYFRIPADSTIVGKTSNNSTRSTTGTGYELSLNTWYRARLVLNSNASRVDFFLYDDAGTQLWTDYLTANIPTSRSTACITQATNAGTTATTLMHLDYIAILTSRTLTR